jgi:hypothetical protein
VEGGAQHRLQCRAKREKVGGGDEVQGPAQERRADDEAIVEELGQRGSLEAMQPGPQPDERWPRDLGLQRDELLDRRRAASSARGPELHHPAS